MSIHYVNGVMVNIQKQIPIFVTQIERRLWRVAFPNGMEVKDYKLMNGILVRGNKNNVKKRIRKWWDEHSTKNCIVRTPVEWGSHIDIKINQNWSDWQRRINSEKEFQDWLEKREGLKL